MSKHQPQVAQVIWFLLLKFNKIGLEGTSQPVDCNDTIDYCLEYYENGHCEKHKQSMEYYCKKTCNFC